MKQLTDVNVGTLLWVFLLLCLSGNPIICINPYVREIYFVVAIVLLIYRIFIAKLNILSLVNYCWLFIFISLLQVITINASLSSSIFLLIKLYIGYAIISIAGKKFVRGYIDVMFILALISLPLYAYNVYRGFIPGLPFSEIGVSLGVYTELLSNDFGLVQRNSGMFWEPGAYQGYLNIAICFALIQMGMKHRLLKLTVLIVALLTTKSTTGYISLAFILLFYTLFIKRGSLIGKISFSVILIVAFLYAYYGLDFLQDKIITENTKDMDEGGRINDYIKYSSIILSNLFVGISANVAEIAPSGNGFVSFLLYYGMFGVGYYFFKLYRNIRRQRGLMCTLLIFFVILLTLQGEGFIYYPLYLTLPLLQFDSDIRMQKLKFKHSIT